MRILAVASLILVAACQREAPAPAPANQSEGAEAPAGPVKGVDRSRKGRPAPDVTFNNPDGGEIDLADCKGVPTLVNLWASWCAPCVKELPTLDALAARHERDGDLGVIAVSQDSAPQGSVEAFLAKLKVKRLGAYHDPKMALSGGLGVEVMPTTVLYDAQGKEVWRYVGDLDWSGAEAAKLLAEGRVASKP
ncbi:TlpA family protein disulfide reductase [Sphingomonas lutea]|uniref:TlpA family protein disulfide reductase n=1 Tax=Sphingomonas lutea TaxID=1045317 RepID=A0A7G9SI74_9SPHN|nr:TlpA disulfide reductase family protein [Sphingomonas lutea]QNN67549.1 TlpA family protein disulfide reductase [Sphingomonas lutea]